MTAKICPRIAEIIAAKFCQRIAEIIAMSPKPAAIATKGTCSTQNIEKKTEPAYAYCTDFYLGDNPFYVVTCWHYI
jgi:predicted metal-dependent RNase